MDDNDFFSSTFDEQPSQPTQYVPSQPATTFGERKVNIWTGRFEDEPPLLEELGVNFKNISEKTILVLNPFQTQVNLSIMEGADLTGPVIFCLMFGVFLLMTGKMHFGYIYGTGVVACVSLWILLNLMSPMGIDIVKTTSILGYCLLPISLLAGIGVILPLKGTIGYLLTISAIIWCSRSASLMFVTALELKDQLILIMYPASLIYACFALLAVF